MTLAAALTAFTAIAAPVPAPEALIPWLDPVGIITWAGPWAIVVICLIIFAETGLLVGFILPGDTLLLTAGVLTFTGTMTAQGIGIQVPIWIVCLAISAAAFAGGELGYWIGHKGGPAVFEKRESGLFSIENVKRTRKFFDRFGGFAIIFARFVPVVRTVAPLMAGVGHMAYGRYTIYNAIGALLWGTGFTFLGFALGWVPPLNIFGWEIPSVADLVIEYIDLVLLAVVVIIVVPMVVHLIQNIVKARRARRAGHAAATAEEVEALLVDLDDQPGAPWDHDAKRD